MGRPEFKKIPSMNIVGLMVLITISIWSTGKSVIMYSVLCFLKGLPEVRKRGFYGSALIENMRYRPKGFMETVLKITLGQTILVMWDILLLSGMRQSLMFFFVIVCL